MTEANMFRLFAHEAMEESIRVKNEVERQNLIDLAFIWAGAALASNGVYGSSIISSPRVVGEATPQIHS
jgi:hypothetical protein